MLPNKGHFIHLERTESTGLELLGKMENKEEWGDVTEVSRGEPVYGRRIMGVTTTALVKQYYSVF